MGVSLGFRYKVAPIQRFRPQHAYNDKVIHIHGNPALVSGYLFVGIAALWLIVMAVVKAMGRKVPPGMWVIVLLVAAWGAILLAIGRAGLVDVVTPMSSGGEDSSD